VGIDCEAQNSFGKGKLLFLERVKSFSAAIPVSHTNISLAITLNSLRECTGMILDSVGVFITSSTSESEYQRSGEIQVSHTNIRQ
jgi:hypothetical protein